MPTLVAIPILGLAMVFQTSLLSQIPLLHGTADLTMLAILAWTLQKRVTTAWQWCIIGGIFFSIASALPLGVPLVAYVLSTGLALLLKRRIWQAPVLAMFTATFFCTLIVHAVSYVSLRLTGDPIPLLAAVNQVTLPSLLLNLLLAVPVYAIIADLGSWLYPEEIEV